MEAARRRSRWADRLTGALICVLAVGLVTAAVYALRPIAPVLSLGVLYVIAVVAVAVLRGLAYAVPVSIASMLVFNFLFLPPIHTFALEESENWIALGVYIATAVVVSELATRSRRLAQQAVEAETLRQSDAAKTAILRAVSHDLRSPLTAIRAASEGLSTLELTDADRDELFESIRIEVRRLERLVDNLLDLSRLEAGPALRRPEAWPVDLLVERALEQLGEEATRVIVAVDGDPEVVRADAAQIERVLVNVLENALKFSSPTDTVVLAARNASSVSAWVARPAPGSAWQSLAASPRRTAAGSGSSRSRLPAARCSCSSSRSSRRPLCDREGADPRRRRRASDPARGKDEPAGGRLRGRRRRDCRGRAHERRVPAAGRGDPGSRAPGRQRHRRLSRAAPLVGGAGARPLCHRRRAGEGGGARRGRRRLRDEAVRGGGAAGAGPRSPPEGRRSGPARRRPRRSRRQPRAAPTSSRRTTSGRCRASSARRPCSSIDEAAADALWFVRSTNGGDFRAIHIPQEHTDPGIKPRWFHFSDEESLLQVVDGALGINEAVLQEVWRLPRGEADFVTVVIPELFRRASLLDAVRRPHALLLKLRLLTESGVVVADVPVVEGAGAAPPERPVVRVLVSELNAASMRALNYAKTLQVEDTRAVNFAFSASEAADLRHEWRVHDPASRSRSTRRPTATSARRSSGISARSPPTSGRR
ncbi:MAG TPA: DUF4118 domain-containing protein [Gaiellaceae bacterium]|jgi:signal transduction histidine kinase|nr:DUF4118 domain-containing protein [Gaiellaceae bacterium]